MFMPQDTANSNKRVAMGYGDGKDEYYLQEIDKLVKNKMTSFAHEDAIAARMKEFITNEINGNHIKLVIKKKLYASDLLNTQNRLSLPINQLETHEFLTAIERKYLDQKDNELEVQLWGPTLQKHDKPMMLTKWHLKSSFSYVLKKNWNGFVAKNEKDLKENTKIHVWSFRRDEKLCFALACIDDVA